jgi:hypothetical protein
MNAALKNILAASLITSSSLVSAFKGPRIATVGRLWGSLLRWGHDSIYHGTGLLQERLSGTHERPKGGFANTDSIHLD